MSIKKDEAIRYNEGKALYDLIHPFAESAMVEVLTKATSKYPARNWEKGLSWSGVLGSLKRHLAAFERGEDYDKESGLLHVAHMICNAHFLAAYYNIYPQGDDRRKPWDKPLRIGLDVDGVLANFNKGCNFRLGKDEAYSPSHWNDWDMVELLPTLTEDRDFWVSLEPYIQGNALPFEPVVYITSRKADARWTAYWLKKNGFPYAPVISGVSDKLEGCKEHQVDIFVDDSYTHFANLQRGGITTFLMSRPWNAKYDVGHFRITELNDILPNAYNSKISQSDL
jgi:hypothetical protein